MTSGRISGGLGGLGGEVMVSREISVFTDPASDAARRSWMTNLIHFRLLSGGRDNQSTFSEDMKKAFTRSDVVRVQEHEKNITDVVYKLTKQFVVSHKKMFADKKSKTLSRVQTDIPYLINDCCDEVCLLQLDVLLSNGPSQDYYRFGMSRSMRERYEELLDQIRIKLRSRVPFETGTDHVRDLDTHLQHCQAIVREEVEERNRDRLFKNDEVTSTFIADTVYHTHLPFYTVLFLLTFTGDDDGNNWTRKGHTFVANFFDTQYARLGLYRILLDSTRYLRNIYEAVKNAAESDTQWTSLDDRYLRRLEVMGSEISNVIQKVHVDPSRAETSRMFAQTNALSEQTKSVTMSVARIDDVISKKRQNLVVILGEHTRLQTRLTSSARMFWYIVGVYVTSLWIMFALVYFSMYRVLYVFGGLIFVVLGVRYLTILIRRVLRQNHNRVS